MGCVETALDFCPRAAPGQGQRPADLCCGGLWGFAGDVHERFDYEHRTGAISAAWVALQNVARDLKVSTHNLDDAERGQGVAALVRELVDAFGAERIMWGSDYCQTHDRPYGELVALGRRAFESLPSAEAEACLSTTARRLWPDLGGHD